MSIPLVTVAIPCHNAERWVRACVESALAQTWANREIIVVDDGSTDGSARVLAEFGDSIRVLTTPQKGAPHARNLALQNAHGEWIQFLDADDYLQPEKIAAQLAHVTPETAVLYSPVLTEDVRTGASFVAEIDFSTDLICQWISWQLPQTGAALWRVADLRALGGWKNEQPCCQEHELYLRALQSGLHFTPTPEPHAVYRLWSEQTLCRRDPRRVLHTRSELAQRLQAWLEKEGRWTAEYQQLAGRVYFEMARMLAKYDLAEAAQYHRQYRDRQLMNPRGPAAPLSYRLTYALLGFTQAERVARLFRRSPTLA